MKKPIYILLIVTTLVVSCTQRLNTRNLQNNNATSTQNNNITTLVFDGRTGGCGFFQVYRDTQDKTKVLTVRRTAEELKVTATPKVFDIGKTPGLEVQLDDYGKAQHGEYCTDVVTGDEPKAQQIKAISGRVMIFISSNKVKDYPSAAFMITVKLEKVVFSVSNGTSFYVEKAEMKDVTVGWLPG